MNAENAKNRATICNLPGPYYPCSTSGRSRSEAARRHITRLNPPWRRGLLFNYNPVQKSDRLPQAFLRREDGVLVLDRQDVIVPEHAQRGNELFPPLGAVAVAAGAEDPGPILLVGIELGIEHARRRQVSAVDLGILGVDVENSVAQDTDGGDGVDALPEHVARVVIAAERFTGDRAQPEQRLRAVGNEAGMHF